MASSTNSRTTTSNSTFRNNSHATTTNQTRNAKAPHHITHPTQITSTKLQQHPTSIHLITTTPNLHYSTCDGFALATTQRGSGADITPTISPPIHANSIRRITIQHQTAQPSNRNGRILHLPRCPGPSTTNWKHWATLVLRNLHHHKTTPKKFMCKFTCTLSTNQIQLASNQIKLSPGKFKFKIKFKCKFKFKSNLNLNSSFDLGGQSTVT